MSNVIVYSTPSCPWCHRAKDYFKEKGVPFIDYDVAADTEKAQEMINKSGQMGVPVIDIDGQIVVGFEIGKINELLKITEPID